MSFWRWCFCLSLLGLVVCDGPTEDGQNVEITGVKFLPYQKKEWPELKDLLARIAEKGKDEQVAEINDYVDDVLDNLNVFIVDGGKDPIPLPGFEEHFRWTIFFGWVALNDGWLRGLGTIERKGDVIVKYEYPNIKVHMVMGFSNLGFDYHYEAKFWGLGPSGSAVGKSKDSKFTVDLTMNMVNLRMNLDKFRLNTVGKLSMKFLGGITADMANILISVVLPILKPIINIVLNGFITDGLEAIIGTYNNAVCTLLADCSQRIVDGLI